MKNKILALMATATIFAVNPAFAMNPEAPENSENKSVFVIMGKEYEKTETLARLLKLKKKMGRRISYNSEATTGHSRRTENT